jgi:hypothetical protein
MNLKNPKTRPFLFILTIFLNFSAFSQKIEKPVTDRIIVKTNLMNLLARGPALTIEKPFTKTFSIEVSFVQGEINNFLFTDHYDYNGFLVRAKKYLTDLKYGEINPYGALYVGNLKRNIETTGHWLFAFPRNFSANSIRTGGSLGLMFIGKKKLVVDGLMSLGYGKYIKYYKRDTDSKGYLDLQMWLSIGYCF